MPRILPILFQEILSARARAVVGVRGEHRVQNGCRCVWSGTSPPPKKKKARAGVEAGSQDANDTHREVGID